MSQKDGTPKPANVPTPSPDAGEGKVIPKAVIKRLSLYARVLQLLEFENVEKVSSAELARRLGLNSAQVRKDLACFGQFGVPGFGYYVSDLRKEVRRILGTDRQIKVILVGVGNLGSALLSYGGFTKQGLSMLWGFDAEPEAASRRVRSAIPIFPISELELRLKQQPVDIAVLTVPVDAAQPIVDRLVTLGVSAILNFVPTRLTVPDTVHVRYVDLALELESLSFYVQDE